MSAHRHHRIGRAALLAATVALSSAQALAATQDQAFVAASCVPDRPATFQSVLAIPGQGVLRRGRDPYLYVYICPLGNPDNLTARPSWTHLLLQCLNPNTSRENGNVVVRLHRKSRSSGQASQVVSVDCPASPTVRTHSVALPVRLDYAQFAYWVTLELKTVALTVEAHMVTLATR